MAIKRYEFAIQHHTTKADYLVGIEIDFQELIRMYAPRAMDNKSGKARIANGTVKLKAQRV